MGAEKIQTSNFADRLSPKSRTGSFGWSVLVHALIFSAVVGVVHMAPTSAPPDDYLDLGYEVFDEPPVDTKVDQQQVRKSPEPVTKPDPQVVPDNTPKEMQDEKSDIAGTQAAKPESNIGSDSNGNAASTPYYKIKPKYPKAALVAGIEGWILMEVDITESGEVENVRVVDGENRNEFQSEARRAVLHWKYRPFVNGEGKAFRKTDHQVRVDFKLNEVASVGG